MSGGACVDRAATIAIVLRDVRRDAGISASDDEVCRVVGLVRGDRASTRHLRQASQHLDSGRAFRVAVGDGELGVDHGFVDRLQYGLPFVGDGVDLPKPHSEAVELIGQPTRVGVEGLANENFVSYDDYLGEHFTNVISLVLFRQGVADLNSPVVDGTPTRFQFGAKGAQSFWFCRC